MKAPARTAARRTAPSRITPPSMREGLAVVLEELNRVLVTLGGRPAPERAEVTPASRLGILLARVEPVAARGELANHAADLPSPLSHRFATLARSRNGTVACVSCHDPDHGWADPRQLSARFGRASRQAQHVGAVPFGQRTEAERLVEPRGGGIGRAQAQRGEAAAGGGEDLGHQRARHALPPRGDEDVEVAHAPNLRIAGVGIDVEPAYADQPLVQPGAEGRLAGLVEGVGAVTPLVDQSPHEAHPGRLALGHERLNAGGELAQTLATDPAARARRAELRLRSEPGDEVGLAADAPAPRAGAAAGGLEPRAAHLAARRHDRFRHRPLVAAGAAKRLENRGGLAGGRRGLLALLLALGRAGFALLALGRLFLLFALLVAVGRRVGAIHQLQQDHGRG